MLTLPKPDEFGNYYIQTRKGDLISAIFVSGRVKGFFALISCERGVMMDKEGIRYFDDPQQALNAINSARK